MIIQSLSIINAEFSDKKIRDLLEVTYGKCGRVRAICYEKLNALGKNSNRSYKIPNKTKNNPL